MKIIYGDDIHSCVGNKWVRLTRISHEGQVGVRALRMRQRQKILDGSAIAWAVNYSLNRWVALTRFLVDGDLPMTTIEQGTASARSRVAGFNPHAFPKECTTDEFLGTARST